MNRLLVGLVLLLPGFCGMFGNAWAAALTVVHEFPMLDKEPQAELLLASDGAFYGTTVGGGAKGQGTLFKLVPGKQGCRVLYHFSSTRNPAAMLAETKDGLLLGTTSGGGASGLGTIFKIDKSGAKMTVLHHFTGTTGDGRAPFSGLRTGGGSWFGTTDEGGAWGFGTVYRINEDGNQFRVIHHFGGRFRSDGEKPRGSLCRGTDGRWYGTTAAGSFNDLGTVFSIDDDGKDYRILHAFAGSPSDGVKPFAGLIEGSDGKLYGATVAGGQGLQGTIFRLNKDGSGYAVLHAFAASGDDGRNPYSGLLQTADNKLYGVALNGGARAGGVIFRLNGDGSNFEILHAFSNRAEEGRGPYAALSLASDGAFYGATTGGSSKGAGALYRLQP